MSSLLPLCEPLFRSMPTYSVNWNAPSICPSTPSVCQSTMVQRGKKGKCRAFWVTDRKGEESIAWWWESQQWYRWLFFRWLQNLCGLVCLLHSAFFLIHISTSFIFSSLSLLPITFLSSLTIFSIFFSSQNETLHFQVTFWLSGWGGFSLLWLCSIVGLCTYFHCGAPLPRKTWTSLNCSALEKTRLRRSMMLKGGMIGKCSLTCNIPDSSRKLGRPDQGKAGPDCLTSAQNYLWASNQEVLTPSTDPLLLFSKKSIQTLSRTPLVLCLLKTSNKSLIGSPSWRSDECIDVIILGISAWRRNLKKEKNNLKSAIASNGSQEKKRQVRNRYY